MENKVIDPTVEKDQTEEEVKKVKPENQLKVNLQEKFQVSDSAHILIE